MRESLGTAVSDKVRLFPQKHEWAYLHGGWIDERSLSESAEYPELEPVEVVGALLDIVFVAMMLEVEHAVTPEGGGGFRAGNEMADEAILTTLLRRDIVGEELEHGGAWRDN